LPQKWYLAAHRIVTAATSSLLPIGIDKMGYGIAKLPGIECQFHDAYTPN